MVYKLKTYLNCETGIQSLSDLEDVFLELLSLIHLKTKGELVFSSDDVLDVCISCKKFFRRNVSSTIGGNQSLTQTDCNAL